MDYHSRFKKGVVLITVIIFIVILSILAVTVLFIMTNEARLTENQIERIRAHYAAQAGIQHYLELLKSGPPGPIVINDFEGTGIRVNIDMFDPPLTDPTCAVLCECPQGNQTVACIKATATYQ